MGYIPNLQEPQQSTNSWFIFSSHEDLQKKSVIGSTYSSLPFHLSDSLELNVTSLRDAKLDDTFPKDDLNEIEPTSITIPHAILRNGLSGINAIRNTQLNILQVIDQHAIYDLALNIQSLFAIRQNWEARNTLVHDLSHSGNWQNLSNLMILFNDVLEAERVLKRSSDLITISSASDIQALERLYTFREATSVLKFLQVNRFLVPLLAEAYRHIRNFFLQAEIFLEVVTDPEVIGEEQLVIFIAVEQNADEASQALSQFDEDWWLDAMEQVQDKLCVTLEFR